MRIVCIVVIGALASGCERDYLVTRRSFDALRASASANAENTAVPALEDDIPVDRRYLNPRLRFVRASRLELLPTDAAPPGFVHAHAPAPPRSRPLLIGGAVALGIGVVLVVAGAAYAVTPTNCTGEFCGFGQAMAAVTILAFGGAAGLAGIVLTAIGGSSPSPEVPSGDPRIVYLPR